MFYLGIALGAVTIILIWWNLTLDALWQPTDRITVRRILSLAKVKPGEVVIDLGCGDGRIVIAAAREFGARSLGVEIDPFRALWGKAWIRLAGLSDRARIAWGDMYKFNISQADVVVLFLSSKANEKLGRKLATELKPGARIVSYFHPLHGFSPAEIGEAKGGYPLFLYHVGGRNGQIPR